ncbi:hypothetical protein [Halococcus sp. AFM35]|uniref:hypothetical protein n=1 Tax=Halococcus sp. AFM35 TaxID=3421653 RepID=UPI003EC0A463
MAATSDEQDTETDLAAWVTGRRRGILQAIRFHGGEANTSEVREYTGLSRGSFDHHIDTLLNPPEHLRTEDGWLGDEGLIEVAGHVNIGAPSPARLFTLTETGEKSFEKVVDDVGVQADDVRDLQQRVEELEQQNEELAQQNEKLADAFNDLREYVKSLDGA